MCHFVSFSDVRSVQVGEGQSGALTFDENIFKTSVLTGSSETTSPKAKVLQPVQENEGEFYRTWLDKIWIVWRLSTQDFCGHSDRETKFL